MKIIGHEKIVEFLKESIKNKRLIQSYLFCGPEHIGKETVATYFAASLLCDSQDFPCRECESCHQVFKERHPDICYIRKIEDKNISIDQIREIKESVNLAPLFGSSKVVIIEDADSLTISATNSLLKLLEEPPPHVFIILLARGFSNLPTTIRSRCQVLRFLPPSFKKLSSSLKEEFDLSLIEVQKIIGLSLGLPGLAIELANNKEESLNGRERLIEKFILFLSERNNLENKFKLASLILKLEVKENLFFLLQFVRDLIIIKLKLKSFDSFQKEKLLNLSEKYSLTELYLFINQILKTQVWLNKYANKKLSIENLVLNDFV